jgi:signal transduction histidine kinase
LSPELQADIERALATEQQQVTAAASSLRLAGSVLFSVLAVVAWRVTGRGDWAAYLLPLGVYLMLSAIFFGLRRRPVMLKAAWVPPLVDVACVGVLQLRTLPLSPFPSGVAGFSLGIFGLLVALSALTLRGRLIYLAAVASIAAQCVLMRAANVSVAPMIAAAVVLLLEARALYALTYRVRSFLFDLASAEAERQVERRQVEALKDARATIESMLTESRGHNDQLLRLQRDKDQLTQLLVHDLRAPLTVVIGGVELALVRLERAGAPPKIGEDLESAKAQAVRLTSMINDLLGIAKLEEGALPLRREALPVEPLMMQIEAQLGRFDPKKKLVIEALIEPGLMVDADPGLMRRVLENLASNAVRYTPDGRRLRLSAVCEGKDVVLRVQNDGPPLPLELQQRLFEKYQQETGTRSGWGLGLYFCRLVLEAHGGGIAIENAPGWDVTMALRLPALVA